MKFKDWHKKQNRAMLKDFISMGCAEAVLRSREMDAWNASAKEERRRIVEMLDKRFHKIIHGQSYIIPRIAIEIAVSELKDRLEQTGEES